MKVKITEQQIENLIKKLDLNNLLKSDTFSNFITKLYSNIERSNLSPELKSKLLKFGSNINNLDMNNNHPNEMMHPLGHKRPISSEFGFRHSIKGSRYHKGIDIATPSGSPVYAPLDGMVIDARDTYPNGCGGFIKLNHGEIYTKFCHLRQINVRPGEIVKKGDMIGLSGGGINDPMHGTSTGPHLHYEILNKNHIALNPVIIQSNLTERLKKKSTNKIKNFIKYVIKELKIKHPPTIIITHNKDGIKTTANYDYSKDEKIMKIYCKNRMLSLIHI